MSAPTHYSDGKFVVSRENWDPSKPIRCEHTPGGCSAPADWYLIGEIEDDWYLCDEHYRQETDQSSWRRLRV